MLNDENGALRDYRNKRYGHYKSMEFYKDINIRDAFFGGRTNNLMFNYKAKDGESIKYFDVTSLYPYVLVNRDYPIGHPKVLTEFVNTNISNYFGFIKCKVSAPKDLYLPVLPYRSNDKLLFPLCIKCAETQSNECMHSEIERQFVGTWFTEEVKEAVKQGYIVHKIYQY
jgi:hypothetical protein